MSFDNPYRFSSTNYSYKPSEIVVSLRQIPPVYDAPQLSLEYVISKSTITIFIGCVSFCAIMGLYMSLYSISTIQKFLPFIENVTCLHESDKNKNILWGVFTFFFLLFVIVGLTTNFFVFYSTTPLNESILNLKSTLFSLNELGTNTLTIVNRLLTNLNKFNKAKNVKSCKNALKALGLSSLINDQASFLTGSVDTASNILDTLTGFGDRSQSTATNASTGSQALIITIAACSCISLVFLLIGYFWTSTRKYLSAAIVTGLVVVSFITFFHCAELSTLAIVSEGCYDPVHTVDAISAKYARVSAGRVFKYYVECNNNTVIQNPITELLNSSFYNALVINNTLNSNYMEINNYLSEQGYSGVCLVDMSHAINNVLNTINILSQLITCSLIYPYLFEIISNGCTYLPTQTFYVWISHFTTSWLLYMAVFMASTSYLFREPDPIILRGDQKPGFQITTDEENADGIEIPVWQDDSNCNNHSTRLEDGDEEGAVTGAVTEEVTSDGVLIEKCNDIPNQLSSKHENESIPVTETGDSVGIDSECCMDAEEKHT